MLPQGPLLSAILPLLLLHSHKLALTGMRTFPVGGHPSSSPELCQHLTASPACTVLPNLLSMGSLRWDSPSWEPAECPQPHAKPRVCLFKSTRVFT